MKMHNITELRQETAERLTHARQPEIIALYYGLITVAVSALLTVIQFALDRQISQTGGLHNIGLRSIFSSASSFLPVLQAVIFMCLDFGYLAAAVRISRGQYTSPNTLRAGMDRFWPLVRVTLLKNLMYMGMIITCAYISAIIFVATPFSKATVELMTPMLAQSSILNPADAMPMDAASQNAIMASMSPVFGIFACLFCIFFIPMIYRFRMTNYVLYDHPEFGAMFALRASRGLMYKNRMALLKLDLSFWWFYLLNLLITALAYGDMLLPLIGISLPLNEDVSFFLFFLLSLAARIPVFYFLRNQVAVAYAAAYNSILPPKKEPQNGVVLGNIFQM